eukprot:3764048-Pleurochrysis_carterae.AAC.2
MAIVGEILAARRVAQLKRIISLGFDETTKFQVGTLSTNVQGEAADGSVVDIVLRGAFVVASGTAEHVVDAVEKKLARGRKYLWRWIDKLEKMSAADGSGAVWSGPRPRELSLERLAGSL